MSLLNEQLSRELIRDQERNIQLGLQRAVRIRAVRRARRAAQVRALWLRHILLNR